MGKNCCAIDQTNRFHKKHKLPFIQTAKVKEKRQQWIAAIHKNKWNPDNETWIWGWQFVLSTLDFWRRENTRIHNAKQWYFTKLS